MIKRIEKRPPYVKKNTHKYNLKENSNRSTEIYSILSPQLRGNPGSYCLWKPES